MSSTHAFDTTAAAAIRQGDRDAFERVFRSHYPHLLRFAASQLRDRADAEDVVHDVFLRLWRRRAELEVGQSLRSYLVSAVRHRIIDLARSRASRARIITAVPDAGDDPARAADGRAPADPAQLAQLDEAIRAAVAALPERCRTAFLLCRDQDLTYSEAAEVMGVSTATVKTQMARALAQLRSSLAPFLALALVAGALMA